MLAMKVPSCFPSLTDADILCLEIIAAEQRHERHAQLSSNTAVCHEVGSQRVASAIGPAWSFSRGCHSSWTSRLVRIRYVSNSLFPTDGMWSTLFTKKSPSG